MVDTWKESYDKPRENIKKLRHHFATKVHIIKDVVFPAALHGCESWTIKKIECWRIDAHELWCWSRLLRVPWTARRSNQSILKEINSEYSPEGLMLKLKLPYFGHLMWRANSLEKTLMLGKIEGRIRGDRGWDGWMALLTQWTWVWANSGRWWRSRKTGVRQSMGSQGIWHNLATEQQQDNYVHCYNISGGMFCGTFVQTHGVSCSYLSILRHCQF